MSRENRRTFLKQSAAAAVGTAAFTIAGTRSSGRVLGANDTIRMAVAGLRGRGSSHVDEFTKMKDVQITYLVDPDARTFAQRAATVKERTGVDPKQIKDIREALDDPNVDAISIATPNHWHSLMTIWACQAGKDVYVEKPCSHNIHEGRIAVETARKHNRIVQHGTQSRSSGAWAGGIDFVRSGQAGKLLVSRGLCYKPRGSIGIKPPSEVPEQLDFNIWLGPAPEQPYHANLVPYNWHWFWDTGNGDIGNQGVHQMDLARWGIPGAALPKSVISLGGRFGYVDQGETPNSQIAIFDFGESQLIFEVRGLSTPAYEGQKVGNILHCENGMVIENKFIPKGSTEPQAIASAPRGPGGGNFGNFIAAVRSRQQSDLNADILEGHYSSALCHLANMSYRLGEEVPFNPTTKAFGDNKEAYETLERMEHYLAKTNALNLDGMKYRLGRKLVVDAEMETIVGDSQAAAMLTRAYRAPFVVPDKVA
ncbi:MAG: Gfo/Idh/MocA family oxidoreductase [Planctomycetia bacterium]|nr:Gfo/Idh/MocA family oxidoreductase [Planctomycetia bacterium]